MNSLVRPKLFLILFWSLFVLPANADLQSFHSASLDALEKQNLTQAWLLVLWSVDCPPCQKELDMLGKLTAQSGADLAVELVSTDAVDLTNEVSRALKRHQLDEMRTWQYAARNKTRIQYSIDEQWRGEMPRSYFYQPNGLRCPVSGTLNKDTVLAWFDAEHHDCKTLRHSR
ncbi:MAG: TlpA family protein disulfide reductase [bacterium]|nr:TlpA family protein disulfide reductase [Gammaproteobacteria bacterium]HIL94359.1 TlpA family protein disulfide reductase [Pseudomonadales bacterium]